MSTKIPTRSKVPMIQIHIDNAKTICDTTNSYSWKERVECLEKLERVFDTNKVLLSTQEAISIVEYTEPLVPGLIKQLTDARSAVVKTACNTVSTMGKATGRHFSSVATALIPTLLGLSYVTIRVISNSGKDCIEKLIEYCRFDVEKLMNGIHGKNEPLRISAIQGMHLILQKWSKDEVNPYFDGYLRTAKLCIHDASPIVREHGRKTLVTMSEIWPEQIKTIAEVTDRTVRSAMRKEFRESELVKLFCEKYEPLTPLSASLKRKKKAVSTKHSATVEIFESKTPGSRISKTTPLSRIQKPSVVSPSLSSSRTTSKNGASTPRLQQYLEWKLQKEVPISNEKLRQRHDIMKSPTLRHSILDKATTEDPEEPILEFNDTKENQEAALKYVLEENKQYFSQSHLLPNVDETPEIDVEDESNNPIPEKENSDAVAEEVSTPSKPNSAQVPQTDECVRALYDRVANIKISDDTPVKKSINFDAARTDPTDPKVARSKGMCSKLIGIVVLLLFILVVLLWQQLIRIPDDISGTCAKTIIQLPKQLETMFTHNTSIQTLPNALNTDEISEYRKRAYGDVHREVDIMMHAAKYEVNKTITELENDMKAQLEQEIAEIKRQAEQVAKAQAAAIIKQAETDRDKILSEISIPKKPAIEEPENAVDLEVKQAESDRDKLISEISIPEKPISEEAIEEHENTVDQEESMIGKVEHPDTTAQEVTEQDILSTSIESTTESDAVQYDQTDTITEHSVDSFWIVATVVIGLSIVAIGWKRYYQRKRRRGWTVVSEPASEATQQRIRAIKARRASMRILPEENDFSSYGSYIKPDYETTDKHNGVKIRTPVRRSRRHLTPEAN